MTNIEVVAGVKGLKRDLVHLPRLHPDHRLIVAVSIAQALNRFVEVVSAPVRVNIQHFDRKVRVLRVR